MIFSIIGWILRIISDLLNIYSFLTWIPRLLVTKVGRVLGKIVEPYLEIFERFIPPIAGISFAPVVALLVIYFVNNYVLYWIANIIRYVFIR